MRLVTCLVAIGLASSAIAQTAAPPQGNPAVPAVEAAPAASTSAPAKVPAAPTGSVTLREPTAKPAQIPVTGSATSATQ
jgi:hypothetical protein